MKLGEETHIINGSVELSHKVKLFGVSVEFEGGKQGTHNLVEYIGLWNVLVFNARASENGKVPCCSSRTCHCPYDGYWKLITSRNEFVDR
jgi:hypothetical protein